MAFIQIEKVLSGEMTGKEVSLRGWIYRKRDQKKLVFIMLRDSTGVVQLACKGIDEAATATMESSIEVKGVVKEDGRAPGGYEIGVSELKIVGLADTFPLTKDLSEEYTRDTRHLWIRSQKLVKIFKIRAEVIKAVHAFYKEKGFIEVQPPLFTGNACEGSTTLFEVKYFGEDAYLSQTGQLYFEALIQSLEKIYTVAPSFRAEKSRTRRHLTEFWHQEMEAAWMGFDELLKMEEEFVLYIVNHVLKNCKKELDELERDTKELEELKIPFLRVPYKQAMEKLGKSDEDTITDKDIKDLSEKLENKPFFLMAYPRKKKVFYMKPDPENPDVVLASDLIVPRAGEIIGGSERISDLKELEESMKLFGLDTKDYEWYLDLRRYGTVPHSGFGMGIDRMVMWLAGAEHIMDTLPFPRTVTRFKP
ncbi:MAG: asparagine--tRNA ligase [Candidatus Aenigmarchaeota archaeon]|nr:asparagine--tRNA ligase [Candidatus Aenigmarchaeota archaeon]